jgi:hypothetical protein
MPLSTTISGQVARWWGAGATVVRQSPNSIAGARTRLYPWLVGLVPLLRDSTRSPENGLTFVSGPSQLTYLNARNPTTQED